MLGQEKIIIKKPNFSFCSGVLVRRCTTTRRDQL